MKIASADLQHRWHWVHHVENNTTCLRAGWGISCMLLTCFVSHSNQRFLTYCTGRSCDFSLALLSDEGLWSIFPSDGATHKRTPRTTHPQAQSVPVSLAELQVLGSAAIFLKIFITQLFQQYLMCLTWKYINKRGKNGLKVTLSKNWTIRESQAAHWQFLQLWIKEATMIHM